MKCATVALGFFLAMTTTVTTAAEEQLTKHQKAFLAVREEMKPRLIPMALIFFRATGIATSTADIQRLTEEDMLRNTKITMELIKQGRDCYQISQSFEGTRVTQTMYLKKAYPKAEQEVDGYFYGMAEQAFKECPVLMETHKAGVF